MNKIVAQEKKNGVDLFPVTENLMVQVSEFKGKKRIDIRKWFWDQENGKFFRSKKGLNITDEEWSDLLSQIDDVGQFVQEQLK